MPKRVFLSYGHDSYAVDVLALKDTLERNGHEVWFDLERLRGGSDWETYIEDGLRWCDKVLLVMTPHSVRRRRSGDPTSTGGFCLNEIAKALQLNKSVVPVLFATLHEGPPTSICRLQFIDMRTCIPADQHRQLFDERIAHVLHAIEDGIPNEEGGQARLLRYLQPLNFDADVAKHVPRFIGREWLRAALDRWLEARADSRAFWIYGGPGLGKSAFAAHLCHTRADVIGCHFCVHGHADKTDARRTLLSLIYQMSTCLPEYARKLQSAALESECQKDAQTIFDNLIFEPFAALEREGALSSAPRLVVIDAVDEAAAANQRNEIASVLARNWERLPGSLKLVVTSRPEVDVTAQFNAFRKLKPVVIGADSPENLEDAREFVEREIRTKSAAATQMIDVLLERSEGSFLYLTVVLDDIRSAPQGTVNVLNLPRGLRGYYQQFFERRFRSLSEYQSRIRPVLMVIVAAREPVPLSVLVRATGLDSFDIEQALQIMGSLFPVTTGGSGLSVSSFHKSVRDWLVDRDETTHLLVAGAFAVSLEVGEQRLAQNCWIEYTTSPESMSTYTLRHGLSHLFAAGQFGELERLLRDTAYLQKRNLLETAGPRLLTAVRPVVQGAEEIAKLEEQHRTEPDSFTIAFNLAVCYARNEDWVEAIPLLKRIVLEAPDPLRATALIHLSSAFCVLKDYENALQGAQIAMASKLPSAFLVAGLALEGLGRQIEALATYTDAARLHPSDIDLWLTLGNLQGKLGDYEAAIGCYEKVLELDQKNLFATSNLAYVYEELKDASKALRYLQRAVDQNPDDAIAWYDLGSAHRNAGRLTDAIASFRTSFKLNPKHYKTCLSLALALEDADHTEDSVEYYARGMSLTDDEHLRSAIAREMTRLLHVPIELATSFEPVVALDYSRYWISLNQPRSDTAGSLARLLSEEDGEPRFQSLRKIREDQVGRTFRAEDVRLHRTVAITFIHDRYPQSAVKAFLEVSQSVSSWNHPSSCAIHQVVQRAAGSFLVTEYVPGLSLRGHIDRGENLVNRGYRQKLEIALRVAEALASAHSEGFAHGRVAPENILVLGEATPKIINFGVARLLADVPSDGPQSPTAFMEETEVDVVGFAALLYELLAENFKIEVKPSAFWESMEAQSPPEQLSAYPAALAELITRPLTGPMSADTMAELAGQLRANFDELVASPPKA